MVVLAASEPIRSARGAGSNSDDRLSAAAIGGPRSRDATRSVGNDLATPSYSTLHEADEGTAAHIFQLLMIAQIPIMAFFAIKWLPRTPRQALHILALQGGAALAAFAPVFFLNL